MLHGKNSAGSSSLHLVEFYTTIWANPVPCSNGGQQAIGQREDAGCSRKSCMPTTVPIMPSTR